MKDIGASVRSILYVPKKRIRPRSGRILYTKSLGSIYSLTKSSILIGWNIKINRHDHVWFHCLNQLLDAAPFSYANKSNIFTNRFNIIKMGTVIGHWSG